jgi:hypothetical protein
MTKEVRERNARTADMASKLREAALSSAMERLQAGADPLELLTPDLIRVVKDSEDRAHGTPKATVAGPGENGEHFHKVSPDDAFAAFAAALGGHAPGTGGSNNSAGEVEGDGTA